MGLVVGVCWRERVGDGLGSGCGEGAGLWRLILGCLFRLFIGLGGR